MALYDALDPVIFQAFLEQPPALVRSAPCAPRCARWSQRGAPSWIGSMRGALLMAAPELRLRMVDAGIRSVRDFASIIAQRTGPDPDDPCGPEPRRGSHWAGDGDLDASCSRLANSWGTRSGLRPIPSARRDAFALKCDN